MAEASIADGRRGPAGALVAGATLALGRLRAGPTLALIALTWLGTLAVALIERQLAASASLTGSLLAAARWAIPLSCLALVNIMRGGERLDDAVWPLARLGWSRRYSALGLMLATVALGSLLAVGTAACVLLTSAGQIQGARDAAAAIWVSALGAAAYVALFSFAARWGRRGGYVWVALLLDLFFGAGDGITAVWLPRAHLRSLLGDSAVFALGQPASSMILLLMAAIGVLMTAQLLRD